MLRDVSLDEAYANPRMELDPAELDPGPSRPPAPRIHIYKLNLKSDMRLTVNNSMPNSDKVAPKADTQV